MKYIKYLLLCLVFPFTIQAQSPLPPLLKRLKSAPQDTATVSLNKNIANYYRNVNPDSALFYVNQGLELAKKLKYTLGIATMTGAMGEINLNLGKTLEAKNQINTALKMYEKLKYRPGIAAAHNALGVLAGKQGLYKEATFHFLQNLKIHQEDNNISGLTNAYLNMGLINEKNNDLDKALTYYAKARSLNKGRPLSKIRVTLLNNTGIVYARKNQMKTALKYFLEGLQLENNPAWADMRISMLNNAGAAYEMLGNLKLAAKYANESLATARKMKAPDKVVNSLINLSSLKSESNPDSSIALLNEALAITKEIEHPSLRLEVYDGLVQMHKQVGDWKKAVSIMETQNILKDSLFSVKKSTEIANLQSSYDLINETVKVQQLQLKNEKIQFSQKIILFITAGIFTLLIIIIVFYMRTRKLNEVLVIQKEELNKLNDFKDKLLSIIGHDLKAPVHNIVNTLDTFEKEIITLEDMHMLVPQLKEQSMVTLDVLEKLLMWGKSHLKARSVNQSAFNVKEIIQKNLLLFKPIAAEKAVILLDLTPADMQIFADVTHVDFIIRNLLANAIKYSHTGGKVEVLAQRDEDLALTTISIKDYGIGIAKEFQEKIFDFDNISITGTAKEIGNSIGLMLCKEFILENKGRIEVKSELGHGTELLVSFP